MTITQKEAWFARYQDALPQLKTLQGELAAEIEKSHKFRMSGSEGKGKDKRLEGEYKKIIARIAKLKKEIDDIELVKREILYTISKADDQRYRTLLYYHYIDGMTWMQVACRMVYDDRYIYKLHKKALMHVDLYGAKHPYRLRSKKTRMSRFDQGTEKYEGVKIVDPSELAKVEQPEKEVQA